VKRSILADHGAITHSVEITAETLYEAAILGMKAMRAPIAAKLCRRRFCMGFSGKRM
jgi:hypothetical protein